MSLVFTLGGWVATVWLHSTILSLAAVAFAAVLGSKHRALRDLGWKVALIGGIFTATLQLVLPNINWRDFEVTAPAAEERNQQNAPSAFSVDFAGQQPDYRQAIAPQPLSTADSFVLNAAIPDALATAMPWACLVLAAGFSGGLLLGTAQIAWAILQLSQMRRSSVPCRQVKLATTFRTLCRQLGMRHEIELLQSSDLLAPLAMGVLRPCVIIPTTVLDGRLDEHQVKGLLAHELAHHHRHDPLWALIAHIVTASLWFQPLHFTVRNAMRSEAEYLADALACRMLGEGVGLARCLVAMAEWLVAAPISSARIGAVHLLVFRSSLKQRVETLLGDASPLSDSPRWRVQVRAAAIVVLTFLILAAPSIHVRLPQPISTNAVAQHSTANWTLAASFAAPALAEEAKETSNAANSPQTTSESRLPASVLGFSGELRGTVVSKDTDLAKLVLKVEKVTHVWKGSTAARPDDLVGLTVPVENFFGRFLDVLSTIKPGDRVVLEAKHVGGDHLQFLGEVFKKVDEPATSVTAPSGPDADRADTEAIRKNERGFPEGLRGFRGILVGKVIQVDGENGTLVFTADQIKRTWPKNRAIDPASSKGRQLTVSGIKGKWLDLLRGLQPGDRVEVEAFHHQGETLNFVNEWLKKID